MSCADCGLILAIDDDDAVRASLKFVLEVEGFAVEAYGSGEEMLSSPQMRRAACLLVDYHLPGIDGVALVSALRDRGVGCPAILMTTDPPAEARRRATDAGGTFIEKPLLGNALAETIRAAVARAAGPPPRP